MVFEFKGNGQQYTNQISLYSQPEITTSEVMNDLKLPENWSYRVYPVSWDSSANYTGFNPQPPPFLGSSQLIMQRYYHKVTLLIGLHYQVMQVLIFKTSLPWAQPFNHTGMFAQGHLAALLSPPAKAFKFNTNNGVFSETLQDGVVRGPQWDGEITEVTVS